MSRDINRPVNLRNIKAADLGNLTGSAEEESDDEDDPSSSSVAQNAPDQGGVDDRTASAVADTPVTSLPATPGRSLPGFTAGGASSEEIIAGASAIGSQVGAGRSTDLDVFDAIGDASGSDSAPGRDQSAIADGGSTQLVIVETDSHGNTTSTYPDGRKTEEFSGVPGLSKTTWQDGTERWDFPDGSAVVNRPNGTTEVYNPDGSYDVNRPPGDVDVSVGSDGTRVETYPSGATKTTYPDGTVTTTNPDGTVTTTYPDGTTVEGPRLEPIVNDGQPNNGGQQNSSNNQGSPGSSEGEPPGDEEEDDSDAENDNSSEDDESDESDDSEDSDDTDDSDDSSDDETTTDEDDASSDDDTNQDDVETSTGDPTLDPPIKLPPLAEVQQAVEDDIAARRGAVTNPSPESGGGDDPLPQQIIDMMPVQRSRLRPGVSDPPEGEGGNANPPAGIDPNATISPVDENAIDYGPDHVYPDEGQPAVDTSGYQEMRPDDGTEDLDSTDGQNTLGELFDEQAQQAGGTSGSSSGTPIQTRPVVADQPPIAAIDPSLLAVPPASAATAEQSGGEAGAGASETGEQPGPATADTPTSGQSYTGEFAEVTNPDVVTSTEEAGASAGLPIQGRLIAEPTLPVASIPVDQLRIPPPAGSEGASAGQQYVAAPPQLEQPGAGDSGGASPPQEEEAEPAAGDGVESSLDVMEPEPEPAGTEDEISEELETPATEGEAPAEDKISSPEDEPIDFTVESGSEDTVEPNDGQGFVIESGDGSAETGETVPPPPELPVPEEPQELSEPPEEPVEEDTEDDVDA